ncbi:hypothetical protein [Actinocorallia populi]|uniref:hypothetical protein n=1 Tax=Actinocorallia populi TaxID=2079200 RepID=UPI000D08E475|nr:hypothetical protein [Actinocorallia populi]
MSPTPRGGSARRRVAAVLALLLCAAGAAVLYRQVGELTACDVGVVTRIPSPDGERVAFVHHYDCGATASAATHVSVLPAGESPRDGGNVLVVDHGHAPTPAWTTTGPDVTAVWTDARRLRVTRPPHARVFRAETRTGGAEIEHRTASG